ncbi:MAG: hypothetical protein V7637_1546 [Mycobacteriales bacterium]
MSLFTRPGAPPAEQPATEDGRTDVSAEPSPDGDAVAAAPGAAVVTGDVVTKDDPGAVVAGEDAGAGAEVVAEGTAVGAEGTAGSAAVAEPAGDPIDAAAGDAVGGAAAGDVVAEPAGAPVDAAGGASAAADGADVAGAGDRGSKHPVAARVATVLAALLVLVALILPDDLNHLSPLVFLRIPAEALLAVPVLIVLPPRPRRILAVLAAVGLVLLTVLKIIDIGFYAVLDRPFDLVLDWSLFGSAMGVVRDSVGQAGTVGVLIGAVLLIAALLVLMTRSSLRLTRLVVRHRSRSLRAVGALAVVWVICAALGAQLLPGLPMAARSDAGLVYHRAVQVHAGLKDKREFAAQMAVDPYRNTPGNQLLTGLQGKDVIFAFVESYGRSALENPEIGPGVTAVLDAGTRQLNAAGFASRSAFLTSATVGGNSWLAHSSTLSGLWVNNQQRYHTLVKSDRLTLPRAFNRAGWRTVSYEPAIVGPWPEADFYGYDKGYAHRDMGSYQGPHFSYAPVTDQWLFKTVQQDQRPAGHAPVFAEVTMVSSHGPFTPIPKMVGWNEVGDGSIYNDPAERTGGSPRAVWTSTTKARAAYGKSVEYSVSTLISYLKTYGDKNLVLVFLGDHQPAPIITGAGVTRDVPITIVAKDPAVLNRISSWGWTDGLRPGASSPVWKMDSFRNKFLDAFSPAGGAH